MTRGGIPEQASSAWRKAPIARTARGRQLQALLAETQRQTQVRRERVFKHEWAKKRVCAIYGLARADQWNGYMPPARDAADDGGAQLSKPNTALERKRLMQLLHDVQHFEATGELPEYATETNGDGE